MSNRKFNLDNEVQPEIHFRLLSISASKFENDWTSFPHSHHFTEIFFIKDGTGRMLIENESLPVSSNSLVVIGAQVTHTEFSDPENPLDYYVLGVEGLKLNTDKEPEYIHVPASQTRLLSASVLKISCGKCITNRTATQRSASIIWIF